MPIDMEQQIAYWRQGSDEDAEVARNLLQQGRIRHAMFFAHLALEKMLKAHVAKATHDMPPRIHDLVRLADLAGVAVSLERREFLARMQQYCLAGRYPDYQAPVPSQVPAQNELRETQEMLLWLTSQLK